MNKKNTKAPLVIGVLFIIAGLVALIGLMTFAHTCDTTGFNANAGGYVPGRCDSINFMQRLIAGIIIVVGVLIVALHKLDDWVKGFNLFAFMLGVALVFSATIISSNYNFRAHRLEVYEAFTGNIPPTFANATTEEEREFLAPQGWRPNPSGRFDMIRPARDGINANRPNFDPWPIDNRHVYRVFPPVVVDDVTIPINIYASNPLANPNHPDFDENAPLVNHVNFHLVWNNSRCFDGPFRNFNTIMGFVIMGIAALYAFFISGAVLKLKISLKNAGIAFAGVGGLIILGLQTFAQQCDLPIGQHGTQMAVFMRCVDISSHIYAVAVIVLASGVFMIVFSESKGFAKALSIGSGLMGIFAILINRLAYTCATPTMPCNASPFTPFVYVMGGLLLLIAVVNTLVLSKKEEQEDDEYEA